MFFFQNSDLFSISLSFYEGVLLDIYTFCMSGEVIELLVPSVCQFM